MVWSTLYGLASGETIGVAATHFDTIRILGVLQRLALAYGFAAHCVVGKQTITMGRCDTLAVII